MASPVVQQAIESSTNTAGTSHVVTLPTATAGDLLLIILDKGSTAATINAFTGLTELLDENSANGLYIAYRWMDGTEPASYTLTSSASTRTARIAYRISGAINPATQAPQIGTTATGTSATPDPPASATPGSSKDYLFIAFYGAAGEEADDDTWSDTPPTNYSPTPPRQKACGTAGTNLGGMIAAAERALTTGSAENPGTFAKDVSAAWRAQTIMIHPGPVVYQGTASFAGAGAFSASTRSIQQASGAFAGTGGFSSTALELTPASAALAGAGTLVADATVVGGATLWDGSASFAGTGALVSGELLVKWAMASFAGAGSFSSQAFLRAAAGSAFAGAGALVANELLVKWATAAFSGAGAFSASALLRASAASSFAGTGSFVTNELLAKWVSASFVGSGSFTATPQAGPSQWSGPASFAGTGNFAANATPIRFAAAAFNGDGAFTAHASLRAAGASFFTGAGAFFASSYSPASATFAGAGSFLSRAAVRAVAASSFAGAGSFTAVTSGVVNWQVSASLAGAGSFVAGARGVKPAAASFAGAGAFTAGATGIKPATASFVGAGALSADVRVYKPALAAMVGAGSLAAAGRLQAAAQASFAGAGTLTHASGASELAAAVVLVGSGDLISTATCRLVASGNGVGTGSFVVAERHFQLLRPWQAADFGQAIALDGDSYIRLIRPDVVAMGDDVSIYAAVPVGAPEEGYVRLVVTEQAIPYDSPDLTVVLRVA